ncbi:MAG: hypothetical protein ACHQ1D_12170 [Nitrososphaerales archaeon]
MRKLPLIFLSLMLTVVQGNSQDILGKWFGISEKYLAEFTVDHDSVRVQMLDARQSAEGHERGNFKHSGIYNIKDKKIIVIVEVKNKEGIQYRAMTFFNIQKNSSIEMAANGVTRATKTIKELVDLSNQDTTKLLFGNVFYHKDRIQEFEKLKDLEAMSVDDFKIYLTDFVKKRDSYSDMELLMPGTFHDQIVNETLIQLGYNPLFRNDWENRFFEKYLSDKEVREIYRDKY